MTTMRKENPFATIGWALLGVAAGLGIPTLIAYAMGYLDPILK